MPGLYPQRLSELENRDLTRKDAEWLAPHLKDVDADFLYLSHNLARAMDEIERGWMQPERSDRLYQELSALRWQQELSPQARSSIEDGLATLHATSWAASHRRTPYEVRRKMARTLHDVSQIIHFLDGSRTDWEALERLCGKERSEEEELVMEFFIRKANAMHHALLD